MYKEYFQKSKIFLYPLLSIQKGSSVTPIKTYISYDGYCTENDCKLLLVFHKRDDQEYFKFEKSKLFGNRLYCDYFEIDSKTVVYVFDFSEYKEDWKHFLNGKYSNMSTFVKDRILDYYRGNVKNYFHVHCFLYPEEHYEDYADMLECDISVLMEVGQLCDLPDLEKEKLLINLYKDDRHEQHASNLK